MPGLVKVVTRKNFVGVVAEKPWQAIQAAEKLKVYWTPGTGLPKQSEFHESLRQQPSRDYEAGRFERYGADARYGAATVLKSTYLPSLSNARLGGQFLRRRRRAGRQSHHLFADARRLVSEDHLAMILGLKPENVHVIFRRGSGCYGLNGADTVTYDAAILSQAVGKPVRVQLTRKDEMAWENYGNAWTIDERAGLDAKGNIVAWEHEAWTPGLGNRPGPERPATWSRGC